MADTKVSGVSLLLQTIFDKFNLLAASAFVIPNFSLEAISLFAIIFSAMINPF